MPYVPYEVEQAAQRVEEAKQEEERLWEEYQLAKLNLDRAEVELARAKRLSGQR